MGLCGMQVGSVDELLHGKRSTTIKITEKTAVAILRGVSSGMSFLHKHGIAHRDLKSPNVLFDSQLRIKICDFAFSKFKAEQTQLLSSVGTPAWMAPEVLRGDPYGLEADVFSFGVIVWELISRSQPWEELSPFQIIATVGHEGARLPLPTPPPTHLQGEDAAATNVPGSKPPPGPDPPAPSQPPQQPEGGAGAVPTASSTSGSLSPRGSGEVVGVPPYHSVWVPLIRRCWEEPATRPTFSRLVELFERAKRVVLSQQRLTAHATAVLMPLETKRKVKVAAMTVHLMSASSDA